MIKISCAPAGVGSGSNLGMNTVDLAIENIVKENKLTDSVEINRPWNSYVKDESGNYPKYMDRDFLNKNIHYNNLRLINDNELPSAVFYWGDFQHGLDYQLQTSKRLKKISSKYNLDTSSTQTEWLQKAKDYFLLNNYFKKGELPFKVAMYGVTLFQNGLNDYLDKEYLENLKWLYSKAVFAKSREAYSANAIAMLREDFEQSFLGVDCALLNTKEELVNLPRNNPLPFNDFEGNIGISFGRSTKQLSKLNLLKFINGLSKKLKKDTINIPWSYFSGGLLGNNLGLFTRGLRNYHSLKNIEFTAGDILYGMSKLSLIVTDTYHVAINAIALDIPVICIYEASPHSERNANMGYRYAWRDKRALLYMTNNMTDFLICSEDLNSSNIRKEKIENIINLLEKNSRMKDLAYSSLQTIAKNDRKTIGKLLKDLNS